MINNVMIIVNMQPKKKVLKRWFKSIKGVTMREREFWRDSRPVGHYGGAII